VELRKTLAELETWEKKLERQESELLCATMREKLLRIRLRTTHQKKNTSQLEKIKEIPTKDPLFSKNPEQNSGTRFRFVLSPPS